MAIIELVLFLVWVNFLPFVAQMLMGDRLGRSVDGGLRWPDGRPLLGPNKTWRGLAVGVLAGVVAAPMLDLSWSAGALAGGLAMMGDLATSFAKRRLNQPSGTPVAGLDQALEGALPLLVLVPALNLGLMEALVGLAIFIPLTHAGSRYLDFILSHPPAAGYPRLIRSTTRLREWRACHAPLARWQRWFNFENYVYYRVFMTPIFKALGWYARGVRNTLAVTVREHAFCFADLPPAFQGYRVLLLTDLHLDGLPGLTDALIQQIQAHPVDLCVVGGDIRMEMYGPTAPALRELRRLLAHVRMRDGVYGVLGNHDCIEMLPELEEAGITMLVNDAQAIRRDGSELWLVGVDDPHYYQCHDLPMAFRTVPAEGFKIFLAHSPEVFREAAAHGAQLYLCGHTHGGQICLPRLGPVFTHSRAPRYTAAGPWRYASMQGYTSRGAGASGVPLRFNCPGEIPIIVLQRSSARASPASDRGDPRPQAPTRAP
jgi:predicted MPP superfamily phosphohydrolase